MNSEFKYPKFFAMIPSGPDTKPAFTEGFFEVAAAQNPKPQTVAIIAADQEFSRNACDGARDNAKKHGLRDRLRPHLSADDDRLHAGRPRDPGVQCGRRHGLLVSARTRSASCKAVNELNYKPKLIGGAMVGLQATAIKRQLGPLLNGWVNYETWVPSKSMMFEGTEEFLKKYQARAAAEGVDPLGYYLGTWGYAYIQVLGDAVQATKSLDDNKLADHIAQDHVQDHHGRHQVRQGRRVGEGPHAAGAVPRHQEHRARPVPRHGHPDRADARPVQDRQRDLSVREGEVDLQRQRLA